MNGCNFIKKECYDDMYEINFKDSSIYEVDVGHSMK